MSFLNFSSILILSYPILPCLILSYPILSYPILSHLILPCHFSYILEPILSPGVPQGTCSITQCLTSHSSFYFFLEQARQLLASDVVMNDLRLSTPISLWDHCVYKTLGGSIMTLRMRSRSVKVMSRSCQGRVRVM